MALAHARERMALPMAAFDELIGGCEADVRGVEYRTVGELVRFEADRAERWYADGMRLLSRLDRRSRACCAAMAGIYHRLLHRIAADPATTMRSRLSLPAWEKATVAARSLAGMAP